LTETEPGIGLPFPTDRSLATVFVESNSDLKRLSAEHLKYSSTFQYFAVLEYDPEPCAVPLVHFRSEFLQTGRFRDPLLGWGEVASSGLVAHELPCNHAIMYMDPIVKDLAEKLAESLQGARHASLSSRSQRLAVSTM
jgi:hypothetical protein